MVSTGGLAAGAAGLKARQNTLDDTVNLLEEWSNFEEEFRVSICQQCPGGCGILGRVVDGDLVKIAGNPIHPVNQGGLCMKGLAGIQTLYDPDRIKTPLKRNGSRGKGKFTPISWDEAIQTVVERLNKLRNSEKSHTMAMLGGQYRGLKDALFQRFTRSFGTPNYLRFRCLAMENPAQSHFLTQGIEQPLCYDLENTRTILSFGCNYLESWRSPVYQQRLYGHLRSARVGERASFIQVDCRYSVTASKADQWIPINPGTDGALALGLANVIIQERLYHREFVQEKTFGFEDWQDADGITHLGFRKMVLEDYPPKKVSRLTGVPVETLFQTARNFAKNRPAIALGERGTSFHKNDIYTRMAIHSLNALMGNIGVKGGLFIQGKIPLTAWEEFEPDPKASSGLGQDRIDLSPANNFFLADDAVQQLPRSILHDQPYSLDTLFLYYVNPLYSIPNREEWKAALRKVPFIVSFSPFMDETTSYADLILPDHTYLERWQDDQITHLAGMSVFSLGRPLVAPVYDTRQTEDVILQIAQGLGEGMEEVLSWENYQDVLFQTAEGLFEAQRGHLADLPQQEELKDIITRQGYWSQPYESYDDFWDALIKKGVWWDAHDSFTSMKQLLKTPSQKFEFYSQRLKTEMLNLANKEYSGQFTKDEAGIALTAKLLQLTARGDRLFLPHFEENENTDNKGDYPFFLNTYKLMSHAGGRGGNQPWLQQQLAIHIDHGWEVWAEINPQSAEKLKIKDGDWVWLESSKGRIRVKAKLFSGSMPQVINMPFEQGHRGYGRWARNRGANPNDIIENIDDDLRGIPVYGGTRVRLIKA